MSGTWQQGSVLLFCMVSHQLAMLSSWACPWGPAGHLGGCSLHERALNHRTRLPCDLYPPIRFTHICVLKQRVCLD